MDPFSIIAGAIAAGAASAFKETAATAVKDAYRGLVTLVKDRYQKHEHVVDSVDHLAKKPEDKNRRAALEEELKTAGDPVDRPLIEAAQKVFETVEQHSPETARAIGIDIGRFKAEALIVENLQPPEKGTALRAEEMDIKGTATFKNIGGSSPPKQ